MTRGLRAHGLSVALVSLVMAWLTPSLGGFGPSGSRSGTAWAQAPYEGFGASTPGGSAGDVVHVTNLSDAGAGSLREAVAQGNRTVVFDVGGTIELTSPVYVNGAFVTIDGFTAPDPGITLHGNSLIIRGNHGAHDVIVRGLRIRDSPWDGVQIAYGAYNVIIDHVSIQGSLDGNIDITEDSHDITVCWSILAAPPSNKNMLLKYGARRISLHHNLFVNSTGRNPMVNTDEAGTPPVDITADVRNNVIWNWGVGVGIMIVKGAHANVVANFTSSPASLPLDQAQGVLVCDDDCTADFMPAAQAYARGNLSGDPLVTDLNAEGNILAAFPAAPVTTQDAYVAAQDVLAQAGARPLDLVDQLILAGIVLLPRAQGPNLSVSFLAAGIVGSSLAITEQTTNAGTEAAGPSTTRYYLSADGAVDDSDVLIGERTVGALAPGAGSLELLAVPFPPGITAGTYFVVARADAGDAVVEASEVDNGSARKVIITLPDLLVTGLSVPAAAAPGASFAVSDTTWNQSTISAPGPTTTRFFLSTDAVLGGGDLLLGSRPVPALVGNAGSAATTTLTIPGATAGGMHFVLAQADADGILGELSETNNVTAKPILIAEADLAVQSVTAPSAVKPGASIKISDITKNLGSAAPSTITRYYLSSDALVDGSDLVLGARPIPALASGAQSSGSVSVVIPLATASATYFVIARADADGIVAEANEGNNILTHVIEIGLDLTISSLSAPAWIGAGTTISVSDTTKNRGTGAAPASTTAFYLSPTSALAADAVMMGSRVVPPLAPGASDSGSASVSVPAGLAGDFYVIAVANAGVGVEGSEGANNTKSKAVRVGPDLYVTSLNGPASAQAGTAISVTDVTRNGASINAPASTTRYYLSLTSTLDGTAVPIGSRAVPALPAGNSHTYSSTVTIPAGSPPGNYFIIAKSDGDSAILEYDEGNNTRPRAITISP